jgi:hypothetical protein
MLLVEYREKKKEELEQSILSYNTANKKYIKLKIETLEWFRNLLEKTTITSEKEEVNRVLLILIYTILFLKFTGFYFFQDCGQILFRFFFRK